MNDEAQQILFKIKKSNNAKDISTISRLKEENKHLYAPNQQFKVVSIKEKMSKHQGVYSKVILEKI